jgi:hypothetical protein
LKNIFVFYLYLFWYKKLDLLKTKKTKEVALNLQITPIFEIQHVIIFILFYALLNSAQIVLITLYLYALYYYSKIDLKKVKEKNSARNESQEKYILNNRCQSNLRSLVVRVICNDGFWRIWLISLEIWLQSQLDSYMLSSWLCN